MNRTIEEPGLYHNIPYADYELIPAIRQSELTQWFKLPTAAHVRHALLHARDETTALAVGSALHAAVLEPERFAAEYAVPPKVDKRTNAGKAEWAEFEAANEGKTRLTHDEYAAAVDMSRAILDHPLARKMLTGNGFSESVIVWQDPETRQACKARIDRITSLNMWTVVVDIKTTARRASEFDRCIGDYGYHIQAAFTLDGLNELQPHERRFLNIVVEKAPPHCVAVVEMDATTIEEGRQAYAHALRRYQECEENQHWPGYDRGVVPVTIPKWARRFT